MKNRFLIITILLCMGKNFSQSQRLYATTIDPYCFSLKATETWREYNINAPHVKFSMEKWAWACSLTFRSKQPIKLINLTLQWNGKPIKQLSASLYQKKEREKVLLPIPQNLVCDGTWSKKKQQLNFSINEKLVAINKYHLVLSFSNKEEKNLKQGIFTIANTATNPTISALIIKLKKHTC